MIEILDPSVISGFLSEIETMTRAFSVLGDAAVRCDIQEDRLQFLAEQEWQKGNRQNMEDLSNTFLLRIMSRHCLRYLMEDERGRSEHHIAGEVCRINNAVIDLAQDDGATELGRLASLRRRKLAYAPADAVWQPKGVAIPCPTIDGKDAFQGVRTKDRAGKRCRLPSSHASWYQNFATSLLPFTKDIMLRVVRPPFRLHTDRVVQEIQPLFYVHMPHLADSEAELPRIPARV